LVLASAAVSAVWRSLTAAERTASAGPELGKAGLPVIPFTMPWEYVTSVDTLLGVRFSDAIDLRIVFVDAAMRSYLLFERVSR
jgi:hypothetical protein